MLWTVWHGGGMSHGRPSPEGGRRERFCDGFFSLVAGLGAQAEGLSGLCADASDGFGGGGRWFVLALGARACAEVGAGVAVFWGLINVIVAVVVNIGSTGVVIVVVSVIIVSVKACRVVAAAAVAAPASGAVADICMLTKTPTGPWMRAQAGARETGGRQTQAKMGH